MDDTEWCRIVIEFYNVIFNKKDKESNFQIFIENTNWSFEAIFRHQVTIANKQETVYGLQT